MTDIHPHWRATDGEADEPIESTNIPVESEEQPLEEAHTQTDTTVQTVSRRPAAVMGITLAALLGFGFYQGVHVLTGQIAEGEDIVQIEILETGFEPQSISVSYGQKIEWVNTQNAPHILASADYCTSEGACLYTSALFENDTFIFDVEDTVVAGTYTYTSVTTPGFEGEIVLEGGGDGVVTQPQEPTTPGAPPLLDPTAITEEVATEEETVTEEEPSSAPDEATDSEDPFANIPLPPPEMFEEMNEDDPLIEEDTDPIIEDEVFEEVIEEEDIILAPTAPIFENTVQPPAPSAPPVVSAQIPTNPNTVSTRGGRSTPQIAANTFHGSAPVPLRQPETGANAWLVSIASLLGFLWITRRTLKKTA